MHSYDLSTIPSFVLLLSIAFIYFSKRISEEKSETKTILELKGYSGFNTSSFNSTLGLMLIATKKYLSLPFEWSSNNTQVLTENTVNKLSKFIIFQFLLLNPAKISPIHIIVFHRNIVYIYIFFFFLLINVMLQMLWLRLIAWDPKCSFNENSISVQVIKEQSLSNKSFSGQPWTIQIVSMHCMNCYTFLLSVSSSCLPALGHQPGL